MSVKVLVTAVGGDLGQALVKALRLCRQPVEVHGCDADRDSVGAAFVDSYHCVPFASATADYIQTLDHLCRSQEIQIVVPGSEAEIYVLSRLGSSPSLPCGAHVICHGGPWIDTYGDKLDCMRALDGKIELPFFAAGDDEETVNRLVARTGFPVVVKSRRSSGSRTIRIARDREELLRALGEVPSPLAQEYLAPAGNEFSAGVFICDQFESAIAFKRDLGPSGCSWFAQVSSDSAVLEYVRNVAHATGLRGSANIQVVKTPSGVRLLEVNPRFSSLVAARAICGFRDLEWSIQLSLGLKIDPPSGNYKSIRFRRFFHELIDFGDGYTAVPEWQPRPFEASLLR